MFEIVTIGTGVCIPRRERRGACALVRAGGLRLAVDLGPGALLGLLGEGVAHRDLDAVLLTHFHLDHVLELPMLFFAGNYDEEPRTRPLLLAGGEGLRRHLAGLREAHGRWIDPGGYPLEVRELQAGEEFPLGEAFIRTAGMAHRPESLAYRFEYGGRAAVVTGDTGPSPELSRFARNADLLVTEASLPDGVANEIHLSARQAGVLARAAGVRELALTHLYPAAELTDPLGAAREAFGGPVTVAADGMRFPLPLR